MTEDTEALLFRLRKNDFKNTIKGSDNVDELNHSRYNQNIVEVKQNPKCKEY